MTVFRRHDPRSAPPVTRSGWPGTALHSLLALLGWVGFALFWYRVFYRTPSEQGAVGVLIVAVLLVVSVSLTLAWIRHNLLLSRRYRERRSRVREIPWDWSCDKLGREVNAPRWEELQGAAEVEIALEPGGGRKVYRTF